jgi:hypothetical protein
MATIRTLTAGFAHISLFKKPKGYGGDEQAEVIDGFIKLGKLHAEIPAKFSHISIFPSRTGEDFHAQAICDKSTTAHIKDFAHELLQRRGKLKHSDELIGSTAHALGADYHLSLTALPSLLSSEEAEEFLALLVEENTVSRYSLGSSSDLDVLLGKKPKKTAPPPNPLIFTRAVFESMSPRIKSDNLRIRLKELCKVIFDQNFDLQDPVHARGWIAMPLEVAKR